MREAEGGRGRTEASWGCTRPGTPFIFQDACGGAGAALPQGFVLVLLDGSADVPSPSASDTVRAVWLADLHPDRVQSGTAGRFVFSPDSRPDEHDGHVVIDAAGPSGVLPTVSFARGQTDEGASTSSRPSWSRAS
jgi:hypothetical protein